MIDDNANTSPRVNAQIAIEQAVKEEVLYAEGKYPSFASHYEAYAFLLDKEGEAIAELKRLSKATGEYWSAIKADSKGIIKGQLPEIRDIATKLSLEAAQIAAVVHRTLDMIAATSDPADADPAQQKIPMPEKGKQASK